MPPPGKRKRGDRSFSQDGNDSNSRPSPHRPDTLSLAQRTHSSPHRGQSRPSSPYPGRGGRRGQRGDRGAGNQGYGNYSQNYNMDRRHATEPESSTRNFHPNQENMSTPVPEHVQTQPQSLGPRENTPSSSLPAAAAQPALTPTPPRPSIPFDYEFLTHDLLQAWKESGRQALLVAAVNTLKADDLLNLSTIFQELLRAGRDGKLEPEDAGDLIQSILGEDPNAEQQTAASVFLDTLATLYDSETPNASIKALITATAIPSELMREQLEEPLLQAIGLVRSTFGKMFIRQQTNILYRQSNYNLLREETEGFSKLITELFTTAAATDKKNSGEKDISNHVVQDTFENIKALIGAFDLDAGRVLDVVLDVFANLLVKHSRFFVKLLRCSSYWPQDEDLAEHTFGSLPLWARPDVSDILSIEELKAKTQELKFERDRLFWAHAKEVGMDAFYELGNRKLLDEADITKHIHQIGTAQDVRSEETRKWINLTRTLPPSGNSVAAQLLGFKLRFYASNTRDATDVLPVNLIYLAALLIKIGFISLRDLYSHLYPAEDSMETVKEKQMQERLEREAAKRPGGGVKNALARAGALPDDMAPLPSTRLRETARAGTPSRSDPVESKTNTTNAKVEEGDVKEPLPEAPDQKVALLRSLLCIGALPEALYMLGRFPWLVEAFHDLPEYIHRIIHHSLSQIYEPLNPFMSDDPIYKPAAAPAFDQTGVPKGELRLVTPAVPSPLRWAQMDTTDTPDGKSYKFYWNDWIDNIPVCQNVDDVFTLCNTFLNFSGIKIGQDPSLLMKLARIGKRSLSNDSSQSNKDRWMDICKRLLCPALSMTRSNPGVVNEVYDLIRLFPTRVRFSIYAEWFQGQISRLPDIASAFALAELETKDALKRINKQNTKPMARALAKVACASPGIVFRTVLRQIESYENLIDVVVECGRYFTYMGYDVLVWSIMSALGTAGRSRVSASGFNTSAWLQSLSLFAGRIFKRYSLMNPTPVLQYVLQQIKLNNINDLRVLKELISNMSGITADTDFTGTQVVAMAGGDLLQAQTLRQVHDKRHESKTSAKRLLKTLTDHDLAGPYLISIAQQRQMCIFTQEEDSNKVMGELFDEVHLVMTQYHDMLNSNMSPKEFTALVPDVVSLIADFGLDPSIAFTIHRKSIAQTMDDHDQAHKAEIKQMKESNSEEEKTDADVEMSDAIENPIQEEIKTNGDVMNDEVKEISDIAVQEEAMEIVTSATTVEAKPNRHPVLQDIIDRIGPLLPSDFQESVSVSFFVTFWQLSLSDLMAPSMSYDEEIKRQKDRLSSIISDRSDVTATGLRRKEQEKKSINETLTGLLDEMKTHIHNYRDVHRRLDEEKLHWFKDFDRKLPILNAGILQECFIPRILLSPLDSYYTYKMLFFLHSNCAPNFRTLGLLDLLFREKTITNLIFQCTSREAENLGRFLNEVMQVLTSWHGDRALFQQKAWGPKKQLHGFAQKVLNGVPEKFLDFEDFRRLFYKWHKAIHDSLKSCLTNWEYMHTKNAMIVLKSIARHFPAVNWMGTSLLKVVDDLAKREEPSHPGQAEKPLARQDLWVAAMSVTGPLKKREKQWMLPQAFYLNDALQRNPKSNNPSTPSATKSPTPKPLSAAAAEFNPKAQASTTGIPMSAASDKTAFEDGEVADAAMLDIDSKPRSDQQPDAEPENNVLPAVQDQEPLVIESRSSTPIVVSKSSKPTQYNDEPSLLNAPKRPMSTRQDSSIGRGTHTLPSRPETMPPSRGRPARGDDIPPSGSDMPRRSHPEHARQARIPEINSDRFNERPGHSPGYGQRESITPYSEGRNGHTGPGNSRPESRDNLDRPSRYDNANSTLLKETSRQPLNGPSDTFVNPDRAAFLPHSGDHPTQRSSRNGISHHDSPNNSRPPSRGGAPLHGDYQRRPDERAYPPSREPAVDPHHRRDYSADHTPSGPRSNRPSRPSLDSGRNPDAMQPPSSRPLVDRNHGRLNQPYQDTNYGRLNPEPIAVKLQPSSGSGREPNAPNNASESRRHSARISSAPSSAPPTPGPEAPNEDVIGVHPSRLRHINGQPQRPAAAQAPISPAASRPMPINTSPTSVPSGPRSAQPPPASPTGRPTPTGPSNGHPDRGGGRRQFAHLQDTLSSHQAPVSPVQRGPGPDLAPSERGASIRGRATRAASDFVPSNGTDFSGRPSHDSPNGYHRSNEILPPRGNDAPTHDIRRHPERENPSRPSDAPRDYRYDQSRNFPGRESSTNRDKDYPTARPALPPLAAEPRPLPPRRDLIGDAPAAHVNGPRDRDRRDERSAGYDARSSFAPRGRGGPPLQDVGPPPGWPDGRRGERRDAGSEGRDGRDRKREYPGEAGMGENKRPRRSQG